MNRASPEARKRTAPATSSGRPIRFNGVIWAEASFSFWERKAVASVWVSPGATTLTRIPLGPSSRARDFMKASRPDLAVLWAQNPSPGTRESPLLMPMMHPFFLSTIEGTTALQQKKAAFISPRSFAWKSSHGNLRKGTTGNEIEAFRTSVSMGPSFAATVRAGRVDGPQFCPSRAAHPFPLIHFSYVSSPREGGPACGHDLRHHLPGGFRAPEVVHRYGRAVPGQELGGG